MSCSPSTQNTTNWQIKYLAMNVLTGQLCNVLLHKHDFLHKHTHFFTQHKVCYGINVRIKRQNNIQ
jgi:hypothetical protein